MAALAKTMAICVGAVGGATACVATGVVPDPLGIADGRSSAPLERPAARLLDAAPEADAAVEYLPEPPPSDRPKAKPAADADESQPAPTGAAPEPVAPSEAVEAAPAPAPAPPVETAASSASTAGSPAGEFGP